MKREKREEGRGKKGEKGKVKREKREEREKGKMNGGVLFKNATLLGFQHDTLLSYALRAHFWFLLPVYFNILEMGVFWSF